MQKRWKYAALTAAFATLMASVTQPAVASSTDLGSIYQLYGMDNGAILFSTTGNRTGTVPACQGSTVPKRFALNASTTSGQAIASVLMTAYSLHKRITVIGTGTCTIWPDTETVNYILVED